MRLGWYKVTIGGAEGTPMGNPLIGAPPEEVHLARSPLARVICQVRFPTILAVRKADTVIGFQEAIRRDYPLLQEEQVRNVTVRLPGELETENDVIWRFADQAQSWRTSLSSGFVSLETTQYESRHAFLNRLKRVLEAVEATLRPQVTTRIGLRYVNRISGVALENLERMVRKEVLGLLATPLAVHVERTLTETRLDAEEATLSIRWGKPGNLPPPGLPQDAIETESWIIDIDMYDESPNRAFNAAELTETAQTFAERIYSVFHWTVTDELLRYYGGNP
jgi:uncharacterized protein (TIGR04255 family)